MFQSLLSCQNRKNPVIDKHITFYDKDSLLGERDWNELVLLIGDKTNRLKSEDSSAFLLLPLEASCPACRSKTIDSIIKYNTTMDSHHYVIIRGSGPRRIYSYFKEAGYHGLLNTENIFLDTLYNSTNRLKANNPTIYHGYKNAIYKKVNCTPHTIRKDLKSFFFDSNKLN
jgi:hypothetical protein